MNEHKYLALVFLKVLQELCVKKTTKRNNGFKAVVKFCNNLERITQLEYEKIQGIKIKYISTFSLLN